MTVLKCKMCGGDIELSQDKTFGTCEHCGSTMTFPKVDDEQRAAAFNRGNHFRRISDFDKALAVYERILLEDEKDAEAHWCCALCRFGIEYVEDPVTYEWIPTCHRASFDSFLEDVDYLAAVEYSDGVTRRQYQKDAAKIAEVQRGILATSQKEEPFDVFICYKESDDNGQRTVDSTLAQDIYYQLQDKGYRVFFARITLEDKVGTEYEPYIFAALNSAKVMVTVGTKPEYYNAVWVKNEWSRFLALMKRDRSKLLLPCYRDMNPYELPEALSVLQSYDMSKIGFVQDLIRGIAKVIGTQEEKPAKEQVIIQQERSNKDNILERGYLALADREWSLAQDFFEQALNLDSHLAKAYIGKFLCKKQMESMEEVFENCTAISEPDYQGKTLNIDTTELEALERQAVVPNYLSLHDISARFYVNTRYETAVGFWQQKYDNAKNMLANDKDYAKALDFSEGAELEEVRKLQSDIDAFYKEQIAKAEQEEEARITKITEDYGELLKSAPETLGKIKEYASERREKDFEKTVSRLNDLENRNSLEADLRPAREIYDDLVKEFQKIGDYKTSYELIEYCREKKEAAIEAERMWRKSKRHKAKIVKAGAIVIMVISAMIAFKISAVDEDAAGFVSFICIVEGLLRVVVWIARVINAEKSKETEIGACVASILVCGAVITAINGLCSGSICLKLAIVAIVANVCMCIIFKMNESIEI